MYLHNNSYFGAHRIPKHGTYVDGGLRYNNPALLALEEVRRFVPEYENPDQLVTVGTGTCVSQLPAVARTGLARIVNESSIGPAISHYVASFEGEKMSEELFSVLSIAGSNPSRWYRRFDLPVKTQLPDLADVGAMDSLSNAAQSHFATDPAVEDVAMALLASNFYLELRRMPLYEKRLYMCYGRILSRVSTVHPAFESLFRRLDALGARFVVQGRSHKEARPTLLSIDQVGNFCKPVLLYAKSLDQVLDIQIKFANSKFYDISANRLTLKSLIERQRLDWVRDDVPAQSRIRSARSGARGKRQAGKNADDFDICKRRRV